jgi:hypothetical protein
MKIGKKLEEIERESSIESGNDKPRKCWKENKKKSGKVNRNKGRKQIKVGTK